MVPILVARLSQHDVRAGIHAKSGHSQVVSPHCGFDLPMGKMPDCAFGALFFSTSPPPSSRRRRSISLSGDTGWADSARTQPFLYQGRAPASAHAFNWPASSDRVASTWLYAADSAAWESGITGVQTGLSPLNGSSSILLKKALNA